MPQPATTVLATAPAAPLATPTEAAPAHATAQLAQAVVIALLTFSATMFAAALAGTQPHPPAEKLPFVATNLALGLAALRLLGQRHRWAGVAALLAGLAWIPSVGVHKFLTEPHAALLTPVLLVGTAGVAVLLACGARLTWPRRTAPVAAHPVPAP